MGSEARYSCQIFNTSLRSPKSSEFQPRIESPRSLRCTLGRYNVRRLRWPILAKKYYSHSKLHKILHGRCSCNMLCSPSCLDLSAFSCCSPEKVILSTQTFRFPSCLDLSAFSCCSPEKVIRSTQTFRPFRSCRYQRLSLHMLHTPTSHMHRINELGFAWVFSIFSNC